MNGLHAVANARSGVNQSRAVETTATETQSRPKADWVTAGTVVKSWASSSLLAAEKSFRRIMGHKDLRMLEAALEEAIDNQEKAA